MELEVLVLRKILEPLDQKVEGIVGSTRIVGSKVVRWGIRVGKANSSGTLQVDHVGQFVPASRALHQSQVVLALFTPIPRSMFVQQAIKGRATRSAIQPNPKALCQLKLLNGT